MLRTKLPALDDFDYSPDDLAVRDYDAKRKGKGNIYTDFKRKACESNVKEGDLVLLKQKPENKLMSNFEANPCHVISKHGNSVTVENKQGVRYKRNSTHDVKKFIDKLNQSTSDFNNGESTTNSKSKNNTMFDFVDIIVEKPTGQNDSSNTLLDQSDVSENIVHQQSSIPNQDNTQFRT
ncbi:hypothetical protein SNE40_018861 [Patella caerulea]|uniref:Uncharacterized protein n=1 Tax=Patella caerulea TaxID=87958 RepID=A0AAN8PH96_PATCE